MGEEEIKSVERSEQDEGGSVLSPWEQHASVINLPRYDYRTPSLLAETSRSGFLITCPIKREKSATKEAISILEKFCHLGDSEVLEPETDAARKRKRIEGNEIEHHGEVSEENKAPNLHVHQSPSNQKSTLSLVKLARSGLILLTCAADTQIPTVDVLSSIFRSLECKDLKAPLWCHRIFPFQETCILKEKELCGVVTNLCNDYLTTQGNKIEKPIKFAVGYNRRGLEQSKEPTVLDRNQCFSVVAKVIKDLAPDAVVDLNTPQMAVLVEALPVSGLPSGSAIAGVSILPSGLITAKPRLSVKALISDANPKKS
ncbi:uncharacterized protein LOC144714829 [Wolffia australiana]